MARKLSMELVMLYVKDGKVTTMKLSKHRLTQAKDSYEKNPTATGADDNHASSFDDASAEAFELISAPQHIMPSVGASPQAIKC